jgi:hypothetical protein
MARSLTLERPAHYVEERNEKFGFSLRVPPSWKSTRSFSGGGTFVTQYTSPPFGVERGQTIHASLTLTVETAPGDGGVDAFYHGLLEKLGDAYTVLSHRPWRRGYIDVLHSETPVAVSRSKRYFLTSGGRAYGLACDGRDDIYPRFSRWCDVVASTLKVGPELTSP